MIAGFAGHVNYDVIPGVVYTFPEVRSPRLVLEVGAISHASCSLPDRDVRQVGRRAEGGGREVFRRHVPVRGQLARARDGLLGWDGEDHLGRGDGSVRSAVACLHATRRGRLSHHLLPNAPRHTVSWASTSSGPTQGR